MTTKLRRIREQQSLSVEFISTIIDIDPKVYKRFEDGDIVLDKDKVDLVLALLGIEMTDIQEVSRDIISPLGLARSYDEFTTKDRKELAKLMVFGMEIENNFV